jgi:hypothetical protein
MMLNMVAKTVVTIFPTNFNTPRMTAKMPAKTPRMTFAITVMMFPINPAIRIASRGHTEDSRDHKDNNRKYECSQ